MTQAEIETWFVKFKLNFIAKLENYINLEKDNYLILDECYKFIKQIDDLDFNFDSSSTKEQRVEPLKEFWE